MKKHHFLKCWPKFFKAIDLGIKNFEVRINDRNYEVGDLLIIQEFNPETKEYTGFELHKTITYILTNQHPLLESLGNIVILNIK